MNEQLPVEKLTPLEEHLKATEKILTTSAPSPKVARILALTLELSLLELTDLFLEIRTVLSRVSEANAKNEPSIIIPAP